MALIPKTTGELRKYLETFPDSTPMCLENENDFWTFSVENGMFEINLGLDVEERVCIYAHERIED